MLSCQLPQNLFPQLLRLPEKLLILDEEAVQLQRFVSRETIAQHHVAHMHRVAPSVNSSSAVISIVVLHALSIASDGRSVISL